MHFFNFMIVIALATFVAAAPLAVSQGGDPFNVTPDFTDFEAVNDPTHDFDPTALGALNQRDFFIPDFTEQPDPTHDSDPVGLSKRFFPFDDAIDMKPFPANFDWAAFQTIFQRLFGDQAAQIQNARNNQ
ncbi:MAG: hypothetical protein M1829_001031 [Trizodia sp. TS-e1964]|nr:MAG: hypothetical protein M1829_001031 [Trizodia sp. TS-e1964]